MCVVYKIIERKFRFVNGFLNKKLFSAFLTNNKKVLCEKSAKFYFIKKTRKNSDLKIDKDFTLLLQNI